MERFIHYLHSKNMYGQDKQRIVNVYKRINDIVTNHKHEYDNFHVLIKEKEQIKKWLFENLSMSTICYYTSALCHSISSMDIKQEKIKEIKRLFRHWCRESTFKK